MDNPFALSCPQFHPLAFQPQKALRDYSHPIDSKIVKFLDVPAINVVFKSLVNLNADAFYGQMFASAIPVNEKNFPELDLLVNHCVSVLHIQRPYVVVSNGLEGINAFTIGSDEAPCIAISSLMLRVMHEDQMRFVIGHECGHIAMGHVTYHMVANMAQTLGNMIPVIGPIVYGTAGYALNAWSRRSEITADRAGMLCCGNLNTSIRALLQLETGFISAENVDIDTYLENCHTYLQKSSIRRIGELSASHPLIPKRIEALKIFAHSELFSSLSNLPPASTALNAKELEHKIEAILRVLD